MRILYLHQYFKTPEDAGGTRSYEIARRLVSWGHRVRIITSVGDRAPHIRLPRSLDGIELDWIRVPYSNRLRLSHRIHAFVDFATRALIRSLGFRADVVFATSTPLTIAIPALFASKLRSIPMVFEVRDLWPEVPFSLGVLRRGTPLGWAACQLERAAYFGSKHVIALSPGIAAGVERAGFPRDRIHVIPNAADLERFDVPASEGIAVRHRLSWLQDRPLVVYLGALGRVNGVSYLAHLAASMRSRAPEVRFLVIGDGAERELVRNTAASFGILDRTFFMLPPVPKSAIPSFLSAASVATSVVINNPALWDNSANKFFDALAAGRPVAINYQGWQKDLLIQWSAGIILHPQDMDIAARTLASTLASPQTLCELGRNARALAVEHFDRTILARKLERVLLQAAQG